MRSMTPSLALDRMSIGRKEGSHGQDILRLLNQATDVLWFEGQVLLLDELSHCIDNYLVLCKDLSILLRIGFFSTDCQN